MSACVKGAANVGPGWLCQAAQSSCKVYLKFTKPGIPEALWRPPQVLV